MCQSDRYIVKDAGIPEPMSNGVMLIGIGHQRECISSQYDG